MNNKKNEIISYVVYAFIIILISVFFIWLGQFKQFKKLMINMELNLFDIRQNIVSLYKNSNENIVILDIDNASYEYVMDKYGSWPISRELWGDVINSVTSANAKYVIFDLLFIKPDLKDVEGDRHLVEAVKNNKNVYVAMNFDNYSDEIRVSPILDDKLKLKIKRGSLNDNSYMTFINGRAVMKQLSDVTSNIGLINIVRDEDGIVRNAAPIFKYKGDYYPHLSLLPALHMLNIDSVTIEKNNIILDETHKIPLDETNRAVLNWYGREYISDSQLFHKNIITKDYSYTHIPFWETVKAIKEGNKQFLNDKFSNKIVYVGTSATALSDIKSTPLEKNLAGVELHANFLNNILDNNFIKKLPIHFGIIITIFLSMLVGYCVLKMNSVFKTFIFLILILISYSIISCVLMSEYNLWIPLFVPYMSIIMTFIAIYIEKYLLKSKDYEQTYKLAVTDGLTQLYNHRFFQEQMIILTNDFNRSGRIFSLILIDIDFFKKFNDTYGHQSGDIVLKQVASILKKNSRVADIVSRYGGEEMTIILPNTNNEEGIKVAEKICKAVRETAFVLARGEHANVTISVGVATSGLNGNEPQQIISYCDKCLYKAKENGRNQVVFKID